ncbi:GTPase [uncultured Ruminococcus sp.]|uniref:GTPase n=1 Tax=uncultured Ruminococcus sp. TaxID=165186 RepID=UPI0025CF759B|nr:GTPase [uncultured Ruminococcus sp.]
MNNNNSNLSMAQIRDQERDAFDKKVDELDGKFPPANIIIAGKTGVGKSTLLNAVFKEKLAETDIGHPVTSKSEKYESDSVPIRIWDTVGFELDETGSQHRKVITDIRNIIAKKNANDDPFDKIHCIWYCVNAEAKRFELIESKFVTDLYRIGVPFVIVMTQCFSRKQNDAFQAYIEDKLKETGGEAIPVIQLLALDKEIEFDDEVRVVKARGLKELVDFTVNSMPEYLKNSFIAAQKVDQDCKRKAGADVVSRFVKKAMDESFIRRIIGIRLLLTNKDTQKMLTEIAYLYNIRILQPKNIDQICHDSIRAVEKGELKNFWKFKSKVKEEFENLISEMNFNKDDFSFEDLDSSHANRSACLLALYGFKFMNAVETVWETATQEQLKEIGTVVALLTREMNRLY